MLPRGRIYNARVRELDPLEALRRLARLIRPGRPERAPLADPSE